jgi:hypothetical protein
MVMSALMMFLSAASLVHSAGPEYTRDQKAELFGLGPAVEGAVLDACLIARMIGRHGLSNVPTAKELAIMRMGPWMAKVDTEVHMKVAYILARLGYDRHRDEILGRNCYGLIAPIIGLDPDEDVPNKFGEGGNTQEYAESVCDMMNDMTASDRIWNDDRDARLSIACESMFEVASAAKMLQFFPPHSAPFWRQEYATLVARMLYLEDGDAVVGDACKPVAILFLHGRFWSDVEPIPEGGDLEASVMVRAAEEASRVRASKRKEK